MFNYFFDNDREILHTSTVKLFNAIKAGKYEAYASKYVIEELSDAPEPKRSNMIKLIADYGITLIEATDETAELAKAYIKAGIIPPSSRQDSLHIACASVNNISSIFSLNFTHINKVKTKERVPFINKQNGYNSDISIYTPMEVGDE